MIQITMPIFSRFVSFDVRSSDRHDFIFYTFIRQRFRAAEETWPVLAGGKQSALLGESLQAAPAETTAIFRPSPDPSVTRAPLIPGASRGKTKSFVFGGALVFLLLLTVSFFLGGLVPFLLLFFLLALGLQPPFNDSHS